MSQQITSSTIKIVYMRIFLGSFIKESQPLLTTSCRTSATLSRPLHTTNLHALDRTQGVLQAAPGFLALLNVSLALSRSHQYRTKLMEICLDLGILNSTSVRQALHDDEKHIFSLLKQIISANGPPHKQAVLELRGADAESFMDLLQMTLDKCESEDLRFWHGARRLLVKLSEVTGVLPSSLTIRDVTLLEKDAVFGGGFADIYRALYNGKEVALKRMRIFQRGQERHKIHRTFCKEALVWKSLRHPHVLPFLGVDSNTFAPYLCMVSPWMRHGTIIRHLSDNKGVDIIKLLTEIAHGLNYLHSQNVVHGDLRGGNILIDDQWQACLADFGLTVVSEATLATHTSNGHGSTRWMAPELHDPESFGFDRFLRTSASDIYALGCVCLEVYTGRAPFMNISNDTTVMLQVVRGIRPHRPPPDASRQMSDDVWNLIVQCWMQNPAERLNIRKFIETTEGWKCSP
ncbi:kinase-like domain-containing protein [Collybia nuda]|uniref:Kinase-like domain-containing protein n=1 Tax=Collybia nuda TaxID=64659 RepID=A0A9P5YHZ8_9AGAR|nr:kinase-like domain-containing protein [Collybia nuda]